MVTIPGDGNCCVRAVAYSLMKQKGTIETDFASYYLFTKYLQSRTTSTSSKAHGSTNAQEYQGFLSESTVEDEAPKFLNDAFYHGELANATLLAISNALESPVIVYSTALHHNFV